MISPRALVPAVATALLCAPSVSAQETSETSVEQPPAEESVLEVADTDHDATVGTWGFQVAGAEAGVAGAPGVLPFLGIRHWYDRNGGFEAGLTLSFTQDGQPDPLSDTSTVVFGLTGGWLRTLAVYRHLTLFWEPQATALFVVPDDAVAEDTYLLDLRANIGGEIRLGMFGLPRVGLTTKFSAGFRLVHNGETDITVGTFGAAANSVRGLLESTIGFVLYL